jgi:hypothetical protein
MQNPSAIHWRKVSGALALAGLVWVVAAIVRATCAGADLYRTV